MIGFGEAAVKQEGYTVNLETGENHLTTEEEKQAACKDTRAWMELPVDPGKQSREEIHALVDEWLDDWHKGPRAQGA